VAELIQAVVGWNRRPLAGLAGIPLEDSRVSVQEIDVARIYKQNRMPTTLFCLMWTAAQMV
jgi:hypothetical protein